MGGQREKKMREGRERAERRREENKKGKREGVRVIIVFRHENNTGH